MIIKLQKLNELAFAPSQWKALDDFNYQIEKFINKKAKELNLDYEYNEDLEMNGCNDILFFGDLVKAYDEACVLFDDVFDAEYQAEYQKALIAYQAMNNHHNEHNWIEYYQADYIFDDPKEELEMLKTAEEELNKFEREFFNDLNYRMEDFIYHSTFDLKKSYHDLNYAIQVVTSSIEDANQ